MIHTTKNKEQYDLTGTVPSEFPIPFKYWEKSDVKAVITLESGENAPLTENTHYTLSTPDNTGTLTRVGDWDPLAVLLTIYREVPETQEEDFVENGITSMEVLESCLDKSAARDQQLREANNRAVRLPITDLESEMVLPTRSLRKNSFLAFNEEGAAIPAAGVSGVPVTPYMATVLDKLSSAEALTALGVSSYAQTILDDEDAKSSIETLTLPSLFQLGRNKIINGNFDIWQRGTSLAVTTGQSKYLADRWRLDLAGTGAAATYSRQAFALGQTDVPGEPKYYARIALTNGGDDVNGKALNQQYVEDVRTLAGRRATLSFYAKADAAKTVSVSVTQDFGTGGSPSSAVVTHAGKVMLSTSWQKISLTFDVPSISGKTMGSDGGHTSALQVSIWMSAGSAFNASTDSLGIQTGTFDFAQIQLEEGEIATKFEERPIGLELALCQRYYEQSFPGLIGDLGHIVVHVPAVTTAVIATFVLYKAEKRKNATVAVFDISGNGGVDAAARCHRYGVNKIAQVNYSAVNGFEMASTDATSSDYVKFHWAADAEF